LILANILLEKLSSYKDIKEPELDEKTKNNIDAYRKQLESE